MTGFLEVLEAFRLGDDGRICVRDPEYLLVSLHRIDQIKFGCSEDDRYDHAVIELVGGERYRVKWSPEEIARKLKCLGALVEDDR